MASRTIPQAEWRAFFDGLADALVGTRVEMEAAALELGDQIVAERVPLLGVTYDAQDDLLDVALSGLNHLIRRPREIYVQEGAKGVEAVAVVSADGVKQILHLEDPLGAARCRAPRALSPRRLRGESWIGGTRDRSRNSAIHVGVRER